jgi:hypothetical protein
MTTSSDDALAETISLVVFGYAKSEHLVFPLSAIPGQ